jgi:hypothetical protein
MLMKPKLNAGSRNIKVVFVDRNEGSFESSSDPLLEPLSRLVRDWLAPELARRFLAGRQEGLDFKDNPASKEMNYDTPLQRRYGFTYPGPEEAK